MKKICNCLFIAMLIITACKPKNQNTREDGASSKVADLSVPYKLPEPSIPLNKEQQSWLSKANRHEKNGWIYLILKGIRRNGDFSMDTCFPEKSRNLYVFFLKYG